MANVRQRLALDRGTGIAVLMAGALSFLPFAFVSNADLSTSTIAALGGVFGLPAVLALTVLTVRRPSACLWPPRPRSCCSSRPC